MCLILYIIDAQGWGKIRFCTLLSKETNGTGEELGGGGAEVIHKNINISVPLSLSLSLSLSLFLYVYLCMCVRTCNVENDSLITFSIAYKDLMINSHKKIEL